MFFDGLRGRDTNGAGSITDGSLLCCAIYSVSSADGERFGYSTISELVIVEDGLNVSLKSESYDRILVTYINKWWNYGEGLFLFG